MKERNKETKKEANKQTNNETKKQRKAKKRQGKQLIEKSKVNKLSSFRKNNYFPNLCSEHSFL